MIRHSPRVVAATLVALIGLGACVVTAVCCVQLLTDTPPVLPLAAIASLGTRLRWDSAIMLGVETVVAALGIVLLSAAMLPGRPRVLPLAAEPPNAAELRSGATRSTVARTLASAATLVDGIDTARVRLRRRSARVRVRTPLHQHGDLREQVQSAVAARLDDLALVRQPRVRVRVRTRKE